MAFNWTCPTCNRAQTVTSANSGTGTMDFYMEKSALGHLNILGTAIVCSNPSCRLPTVSVCLREAGRTTSGHAYVEQNAKEIAEHRLIPENSAKPQPDFIPLPLREDYIEACRIRELSPKAAATLARRCLQGMIRDFCQIKKSRLIDEIKALREAIEEGDAPKGVSEESVDAIDHVRGIGNIGAHMEKDINRIVEVDPGEAQALIELIETLFDEWYVDRQKRKDRFARIEQIAEEKRQVKALGVIPSNDAADDQSV